MLLNAKGKGLFATFLPVGKRQKRMDPVPAPETDPSQNMHGSPCDVCPWHIFYLAVPRFLYPSMKMMGPSLPMWLMKIHIKEQCHYRALSGVLSPWQSLLLTPKHRGKREAWRPSSIIIDCLVLLGLEEKGNSGKDPPTRGPRRDEDSPGNTCPQANWVRRSGSKALRTALLPRLAPIPLSHQGWCSDCPGSPTSTSVPAHHQVTPCLFAS